MLRFAGIKPHTIKFAGIKSHIKKQFKKRIIRIVTVPKKSGCGCGR